MALPRVPALVAALLLAGGEAAAQAPVRQISATDFLISATDHEGMPLNGARIRLMLADGATSTVLTGSFGTARVPYGEEGPPTGVSLDEDAYFVLRDSMPAPPMEMLRVFRSAPPRMTREERQAFAPMYERWLADAGKDEPGESGGEAFGPLTPWRAAAFLDDRRRESAEGAYPEPEDREGDVIGAKVLTSAGRPAAGASARLWVYDEAGRCIRPTQTERAGEAGRVAFAGVEPGAWCRIVATDDGGARALSPPFRAEAKGEARQLVLRAPGAWVSGFVFDGHLPAEGALVTADLGRGARMRAPVDAAGYFSLAPVPEGRPVLLTVTMTTAKGERTAVHLAEPGEGELMIPFHILAE